MLQPLLPKKLSKVDSSFSTVEELNEVLHVAINKGEIKNIALTGPFGSGKSSILLTLRQMYSNFEYLPISLATLQAHEDIDNKGNSNIDDEQIEQLNRKIEYSILQQLIYREKSSTVPNSRFRRIIHIDDKQLKKLSFHGVLFFIAVLIAFEPSWFIVDSIYKMLNFGFWNIIPDAIAVSYMLYVLFMALGYVIKSYSNSKLNKLNLKDGEIELKEENSIFNKHLDEILYFFQVTKYNVVIIEDLDRFGTSKIFLKLRELNQLINESKIVGRNVVFLYAVKDDVFINEERTKFFDYITTVIPVINPSNSKDMLKAALKERGLDENEIMDGDLADMAFFIQDMRILTNIANEFTQYRQKLMTNEQKLQMTKLLAMIVYKNYFPKDFAQLHRRAGKVYQCISSKPLFAKSAMEYLNNKEKELKEEYNLYINNKHLRESELRYLYMDAVRLSVNDRMISIHTKDNYYTLKDISENRELFDNFLKHDSFSYTYYYNYSNKNNSTGSVNHSTIEKSLDFNRRMSVLKASEQIFRHKQKQLQKEKIKIQALTLKDLICKYKQGESDKYKKIELSEMMDVFIRRGFIDEEYYDYISYFYEGMVSLSDRDLLLSIKRNIAKEYTYHIDKIDNFVKELLPYMFECDAILNNELLDFLAINIDDNEYGNYFNQVMYRLEKENAPLDFLSQYYTLRKNSEIVFRHYISWDRIKSWEYILSWSDDNEREWLIEGWLKYCNEIEEKQTQWLNANYRFISERCKNIGITRSKEICSCCLFESVDANDMEILTYVIQHSLFALNVHNLCLIANTFQNTEVIDESNLNLRRVKLVPNRELLSYVKANISMVLKLFSSTCKDEDAESILYILNEENLTKEEKETYLQGQCTCLENINKILSKDMISIAYKLYLIKPTWENVASYYTHECKDSAIFYAYIENYSTELSSSSTLTLPEDIISPLFTEMFSTKNLSVNAFRKLISVFNRVFINCDALANLELQRLSILLNAGKLPFKENNTRVLKQTKIFADYLLYHYSDFYTVKDSSFFINIDVAEKILLSDLFTSSQKNDLIPLIPNNILLESQSLADEVLRILVNFDIRVLDENTLVGLLKNASQKSYQVRCISLMIKRFDYDENKIITILNILSGKYKDISERTKRPILADNNWNAELVACLKEKGFISSYKSEKEGIRIWPKRIK